MNVLITGAEGIIGQKTIQQIIDKRLGQDISRIICIGRNGTNPWFAPNNNMIWVEANLDSVNTSWWENIQSEYNIDNIMYLETNENNDEYIPDNTLIDQFKRSDSTFIDFLREYDSSGTNGLLNVIYLSTDKLYQDDKFPNVKNSLVIPIPDDGLSAEDYLIQTYASYKITSELSLLGLDDILLRIVRPVSIVWDEQDSRWPLSKMILRSISDASLDIYEKGDRGLTFTHVDDLINFILSTRLFDQEVSPSIEISSNRAILNFCRVWNYLPEEYLINKIRLKTESNSIINLYTDIDNFKYMIKTPQIRNMVEINIPRIPIETIIEGIYKAMDPTDTYKPLVVTHSGFITNNILVVSGTAEPLAGIIVQTDLGESYITEVDSNGNWSLESPEPVIYADPITGIAFATSKEGIQYDTYLFDIQ